MNGLELAGELRQYNTGCYIVLVSGSYPENYEQALEQGVINDFIIKPISLQRVLAAIEHSSRHKADKNSDSAQN